MSEKPPELCLRACFDSGKLNSEGLFSTQAAAGLWSHFETPMWESLIVAEGIVSFLQDLLTKQGHELNNATQR